MFNNIQKTAELVSKLKLLISSLQQYVLQQLPKLEDDVKNPALQKIKTVINLFRTQKYKNHFFIRLHLTTELCKYK